MSEVSESPSRSTSSAPPKTKTASPEPRVTVTETAPAPSTPVAPPGDVLGLCPYSRSTPTLEKGSSGAAVRQAQCYLNVAMSEEDIPEDGDFGEVTDAAVRRFQACAGITVDGQIGPETWAHLIYWAASPSYVC